MLPKIKTILYATGMGAGAPHVYRYALEMAKQHDAKIIAVSALEKLSPFAQNLIAAHIPESTQNQIHDDAHEYAKEKLQERISLLCSKESGGDTQAAERLSEIRIEDGAPATVVLEVAKEIGADLIIMGSHRHTVIGDAMLGTTTHKVLHSTDIPVLVVRIPDGFHEEGF
ncbi:Nucleotide-binding universal stress protein, UspA family [Malonomonas rubra DSM 5091]|uniref:Nucleotide-binding universal stress protein, UspA family n=1 Tax=Malonomonas rubra DSM 5091 TaxID=1122189 RepID=A0A1M6FDJ7_MALRU|nr:universal stress protein [Malonomonas rubra]SHI95810.1 Nucleotide-binding universal stress protein, UspA family [Malonomonas rubra DSM 5091]